jgi:signal peptidase
MDAGAFTVPPAPRVAESRPAPAAPGRAGRAATGLLWLAVALAVVVGIGAAMGVRTAVVLTGSMRPALSPNDLIITRQAKAADVRAGEIVSFASPTQPGIVITHRVRSIRPAAGGRLAVVTRGDANNTPEKWTIAPEGTVARVVGTVPRIGAITDWTRDPTLRLLVFGLFGGMALVVGLRWVWKS